MGHDQWLLVTGGRASYYPPLRHDVLQPSLTLQRLLPILALFVFLFTGGSGFGAQITLCTHADGEVHLETPVTRCCNDEEYPGHEGVVASAGTVVLESGDCGTCSEQLVLSGSEHLRPVKVKGEADFSMALSLPMIPAAFCLPKSGGTSGIAPHPRAPALAVHDPIATVVLRC